MKSKLARRRISISYWVSAPLRSHDSYLVSEGFKVADTAEVLVDPESAFAVLLFC